MKKLGFLALSILLIAFFANGTRGLVAVILWIFKVSCLILAFLLISKVILNFLDKGNKSNESENTHFENKPSHRLSSYELERYAIMCNADLEHKDEMAQYEQFSQEQNNDAKPLEKNINDIAQFGNISGSKHIEPRLVNDLDFIQNEINKRLHELGNLYIYSFLKKNFPLSPNF